MANLNRRDFVKVLGLTSAASVLGFPMVNLAARAKARVVVVGGGYGGATAAKYIKLYAPDTDVTLIEKSDVYYSCPFSNEVLAGERKMEAQRFTYAGLGGRGINVVHDTVTDIDAEKKQVKTAGGKDYGYDYCVVSPGISFVPDGIKGYDEAAAEKMPHAWKAGPQTVLLRSQLEGMEDGGVVMIAAPPNPFRCPPGPYERASQIAHYLKTHKPKSKLIIMDAKDKFSKQALFMEGWNEHYDGLIEWRSRSNDGKIIAVEPDKGLLITEFDEHHPAVANVIPPQQAGELAFKVGLTDESGWCPVDQATFESKKHKDIFVIGDSCIAGAMPKSSYSANSQGKVCASAIAARITGSAQPAPSFVNTCYSLITPDHGISVAMVYELGPEGTIVDVEGAGGLSPLGAPAWVRKREAVYARSWFGNITTDVFG
jgi:sulfide dehydrogenase [flavocytochrome c] flavoprotein subunit